jgi:hypothetical protein
MKQQNNPIEDKALTDLKSVLKTARRGHVVSYHGTICIIDYFHVSKQKRIEIDAIINQLVVDTMHYVNGITFEKRGPNLGIHH